MGEYTGAIAVHCQVSNSHYVSAPLVSWMGSMWCKPSEFTNDCSPKMNIHSILSRLSSQICPSRCRYSNSGSRAHTKQRPRHEAVSKGCRPVISHPLMQPVPPPRKKRKHVQDLSRSEEQLCSSYRTNSSPLRTANSLPVLCLPISQMRPNHHQEALEMIKEEPMPSIMQEMDEMESLPISEVYFLRKEGLPQPVFDAVPKDVAEKTMTMEISSVTNMANSNFLDRNNTVQGQTRIECEVVERIIDERKEIVESETISKRMRSKTETVAVIDESERKNVVTVNNRVIETDMTNNDDPKKAVDSVDGKKWQDALKSKWLQNILIGSDATEKNLNTTSIPSFIPQDFRDVVKREQFKQKTSQNEEEHQNSNVVEEGEGDRVSRLIVTPECLNETLQRLSSHPNRDEIFNNRNLVFNSQNFKVIDSVPVTGKETIVENCHNMEDQTSNIKDLPKSSDLQLVATGCQPSSRKSSRRSSITDSLQEFESSIYEMLQESAKGNASDEDDSFIALHKQALNNQVGNS